MITKTQSDLLRRLISAEFIPAHPNPATVMGADLDALKAILRGDIRPDFPVDHKGALDLLSRSDTSPETTAILADTLTDAGAPVAYRMAAAHMMRRMPPKAAEGPLVTALPSEDARLRRAVIGSLAQVGGTAAQKALSALPPMREVTSALLMIGLRDGSHDGGLSEMLGIGTVKVAAEPLPKDKARRILDALGGRAAGVPLTPEGAIGFSCRAARYAVLMAREADFTRAGLVAVVIRDGEAAGGISLRYFVLVASVKDGLEIAMVTPSGRADYTGTGKVTRTGMSFSLRDTRVATIPLSAEARIAKGIIRLTLEISEFRGRAARRARTPLPVLTENRR